MRAADSIMGKIKPHIRKTASCKFAWIILPLATCWLGLGSLCGAPLADDVRVKVQWAQEGATTATVPSLLVIPHPVYYTQVLYSRRRRGAPRRHRWTQLFAFDNLTDVARCDGQHESTWPRKRESRM